MGPSRRKTCTSRGTGCKAPAPRGDNGRGAGVGRTRPASQGAWLALRVVPMTLEGVGSYTKSKSVWVTDTPFSTVANTTALVPPLPSSS